jgi:endonuclease/exonuclease/phosphatase family metal-dependent hydrolase
MRHPIPFALSGFLAALLGFSVTSCRRTEGAAHFPAFDAASAEPRDAAEFDEDEPEPEPEPVAVEYGCVHQKRSDLGAPVHRNRGGGGGFIRIAECVRARVIEGDGRWAKIAFPLTEDRTEGWISNRYLMDCSACEQQDGGVETSSWPPQPAGMCQASGATGQELLVVGEVSDRAEVQGGARGQPGVTVTVVSYNVWELYDGRGEKRYLSADAHGGSPASQWDDRRRLFAKALSRVEADVLLLQEVEGAEVACALAAEAWPRSGWSCYGARHGGSVPQNLAIATRLEGTARLLKSTNRRKTGPRHVVEISLAGAGGLTISTVHLKSSRGEVSHDDCKNAQQRMGAAAALANRYEGRPSVLVAGDFNIDPLDTGRAVYDRSDDILGGRGFERLCQSSGCEVSTYPGRHRSVAAKKRGGGAIDLAFFRGGGLWKASRFEVSQGAPHQSKTSLGSDHLPVVITLQR